MFYTKDKKKFANFIVLQKEFKSPMKITSLVWPELGTIELDVYIFSGVYMEHLRVRRP